MASEDAVEEQNQKDLARTLLLVNLFAQEYGEALFSFACTCQDRLNRVATKLDRTEALLALVESKLESVPDLSSAGVSDNLEKKKRESAPDLSSAGVSDNLEEKKRESVPDSDEITNNKDDVSQQAVEPKYVKLLELGMPAQQVAMKMAAEGVDQVDTELLEQLADMKLEYHQQQQDNQLETDTQQINLEGYTRMLRVGVPMESVAQKMAMDGLDPSLLLDSLKTSNHL